MLFKFQPPLINSLVASGVMKSAGFMLNEHTKFFMVFVLSSPWMCFSSLKRLAKSMATSIST
ncbi:hypothetical protein Hanom_Chr10g00944111 [Helianthus anomalus]